MAAINRRKTRKGNRFKHHVLRLKGRSSPGRWPAVPARALVPRKSVPITSSRGLGESSGTDTTPQKEGLAPLT
jgi:hypothetical protein